MDSLFFAQGKRNRVTNKVKLGRGLKASSALVLPMPVRKGGDGRYLHTKRLWSERKL